MIESEGDAARQLERSQKAVEYILALLIPVLLAAMLFSYVLFEAMFTPLFVVTVLVAVGAIVPAYRSLGLHYQCWARNTMPQRLVTGMIGIIYISAASVFGVSLVSSSKGLSPEQPLTFAVIGLFAILLMAVMAYNSRYKTRNERTELRFFRKSPEALTTDIRTACMSKGEDYSIVRDGKKTSIAFTKRKLTVTVVQQAHQGSEVLVECDDPISSELCMAIKQSLGQEA